MKIAGFLLVIYFTIFLLETQSELQQEKIKNLTAKISEKRDYILELKRQIVALEYKCEAQENSMAHLDKIIGAYLFY